MRLVQQVLEIGFGILSLTGFIFYSWQAIAVKQFFSRAKIPPLNPAPPVTILVPVCGLEAGAWENWLSLCQQDYPNYNVLFGVRELSDPAVPFLKQLVQTYPYLVRWYHCPEILGVNYKISNLLQLRDYANGQIIVFVDSDIRVTPDYLATVIAPLQNPQLGVVTCGYFDHRPRGLGAALSALGRCLDFIPSILIARMLDGGLKFAVGPTIAVRSQVLTQTGAMELAKNRIGDDYRLGYEAAAAGYGVELSTYVLHNDCSGDSLGTVFGREVRWSRGIRFNRGSQYYGIGFTFGTVYSVCLVWVSGELWTLAVWAAVWGMRLFQAWICCQTMNAEKLWAWIWVLPLRDGLSFLIWLVGCFGRKVHWRGRELELEPGGYLVEK
ncbi:glycosyltransferase [Synechococcus sp. PCC 6312]|uniref:glycosyltransferase n=1 Tax=Synechococcus sp. (strain ATCC 27167 / PCC 6312) TaxID=195253 RepID=UPI00029F4C12|nr:glycosyltransferase [Synechococcus sp. PCC 6312]AFY61046.1 glycosyl transferase [Synechococcus sp. PCC 6312]